MNDLDYAEMLTRLYGALGLISISWQQIVMMFVSGGLILLAIRKKFEPLLLLPIGFGGILANVPIVGIASSDGFLGMIYLVGIKTGLFPLFIFMGVGAMTDFGPLLANPKTALLGAAAQVGIFATLFGAILISGIKIPLLGELNFTLEEAASIGIIGGADGPTAIYTSSKLAPNLLGPIAVSAYSYMALVPIIQPPIIKLLTTKRERELKMIQLREVSVRERIFFPIFVLILCALLLPVATPLIGSLMFGNLLRESGVVKRLSDAVSNELINIVTVFLGLCVGTQLEGSVFLRGETLGIMFLGLFAFSFGTAGGILFAKIMNWCCKNPVNPMIGAAGVSAVPMAARVVNREGQLVNSENVLLMHAMGPNVAGVISSAVASGVMLAILEG